MQLQAQRCHYFQNRVKAWSALARECFIKTPARQPRIPRDFSHALGASDGTQCFCDECSIAFGGFHLGLKISGHVL
jgi:hypothetical protein